VNPDEVRQLLYTVAKVKAPSFKGRDPKPNAGQKIEELEDHLFEIARWRCELEEARLYMHDARRELEDQWDEIEGWQAVAGKVKTKQDVVAAKKTIRPDLYDGIRMAKFLIERLSEQIRRLERDEEYAVSRGYTLISGG
jgi:hypothetical protein